MNAADLARLELAKRAYRATEPSASEVQRGVRKARLSLRRPRLRRAWFSKTLVAVVLAMGGLAYAKPNALGELVSSVLHPAATTPKRSGGVADAALPAALSPKLVKASQGQPPQLAAAEQPAPLPPIASAPAIPNRSAKSAAPEPAGAGAPADNGIAKAVAAGSEKGKGQLPSNDAPSAASFDEGAAPTAVAANGAKVTAAEPGVTSDWGRVGAALARGDEPRALAALKELSDSDDQRTRDKADLGRAQLFMSNGNRDQACATARSLTNRRAGSRIERQAQVLLKSCPRYKH